MAVRIKVGISFAGRSVRTVAVANAGYESISPEILLPKKLASRNWADQLKSATRVSYDTAGGPTQFRSIGRGKVRIGIGKRGTHQAEADVLVSDQEDEVIMSDKLIDKLNIDPCRPGQGKWRFHDDYAGMERNSAAAEYW